jgi:hypothetical protein
MIRGRRRSAAGVVLVFALAVAGGCSGGSDQKQATVLTTPLASAEGGSTIKPAVRPVNKAVWFAGFKVTLGAATLRQVTPRLRRVDIDARFENQGDGSVSMTGALDLTSAGQHYQVDAASAQLPQVPGKATGSGLLSFDVDPNFSFDDAVVTFGRPAHQQATVPLGSAGRLVPLQPIALTVTGSLTSGVFKADLTGGEIRSDSLKNYVEADRGERFLVLVFNLSTTKSENFSGANLALQLPDGTNVAPDDAPVVILDPGPAQQNRVARFTLKDPTAGRYNLVLIDDSASPPARATLALSLP